MIEAERWHWCESESDSTLQTVELVQEIPWWACCSCGLLIARLSDDGAELSADEGNL